MAELSFKTGDPAVDGCLAEVVAALGAAFGERLRGVYLVGSHAVGEAIPGSDIDLLALFKGRQSAEEQARFAEVRQACKGRCALALDMTSQGEERLLAVGGVWFQTASRLLAGDDIRPRVPCKPVESHARDLMHSVLPLLARVRGDPPALAPPLGYPDPAGALYGYDRREVRVGSAIRSVGTKDLVSNTLAIANALTLRAAGRYVGDGRKADIPREYRRQIGDQWSALVEAVFERCRVAWGYAVPEDAVERAELRALCEGVLGFENHFMAHYRDFLTQELQHDDPAVAERARRALARLGAA
jgi:predicted nucleotidyltransferase